MNNKIEESMLESISSSALSSIAVDGSEFLLDTLIENEALRSIPVLGSIVNFAKGSLQIRDAIFSKKVALFLSKLNDLDAKQRKDFIDNNYRDPKSAKKLGGTLIEVLDHLNESAKALYIGSIFKSFVQEKITEDEMKRAFRVIDRIFLEDLYHLKSFPQSREKNWDIPWVVLAEFESIGLIRMDVSFMGAPTDEKRYQTKNFSLTPVGKLFLELQSEL